MALTPAELDALLESVENVLPSARKLRLELEGISNATIEAARSGGAMGAPSAEVVAALDKELLRRERVIEALERQNQLAKDQFDAIEDNEKAIQKQFDVAKKVNETKIEQLKKILEFTERGTDAYNNAEAAIRRLQKANKDLTDGEDEYQKSLQKAKQTVEQIESGLKSIASGDFVSGFKQIGKSLAKAIGPIGGKIFAKKKEEFISSLAQIGQKLPQVTRLAGSGAGGAGAAMSGFTASLGSAGAALAALGPALLIILPLLIALAVALGVTVKIAQFALELENSARQLTKVTGLSKDFSHAMHENADSLREFGATAEDINTAVTALNATFTDFSMLNTVSASKVKDTTVVLGKLGMSADDAAKGFQALAKGFAQTPEQAADTMLELDAVARDLGVSTAKMGADFAGASTHLQKLSGPEAMQAFKQLAVVSKATGIEVSRLLAITEKFDTFEGAATQAGKLNAALGGNFVNAMELMTATNPVERFEMIRDSILDSGLAFDEMSYFQKKFFADAAGMADVGELALAMSGDFGAVGAEVGKTQADFEAAAKRARDLQSVEEQLKNTMQSLVPVVKPLIEKIGEMTIAFSEFVEKYKDEIQTVFKGMMYFVGALAFIFVIINIKIIAVVAAVTALVAVFSGLIGMFGDLIGGLTGTRKALTVDADSPTLLGGIEEMASGLGGIGDASNTAMGSVDKLKAKMTGFRKELFSGDDNLVAGVKMTAEGMEGVGDASAKTAATMRATAPTIANNTAIRNVANNTANKNNVNNTTYNSNNNTSDNKPTAISIKFDNKKFADLFDVQVEKSIGRAARKAVV